MENRQQRPIVRPKLYLALDVEKLNRKTLAMPLAAAAWLGTENGVLLDWRRFYVRDLNDISEREFVKETGLPLELLDARSDFVTHDFWQRNEHNKLALEMFRRNARPLREVLVEFAKWFDNVIQLYHKNYEIVLVSDCADADLSTISISWALLGIRQYGPRYLAGENQLDNTFLRCVSANTFMWRRSVNKRLLWKWRVDQQMQALKQSHCNGLLSAKIVAEEFVGKHYPLYDALRSYVELLVQLEVESGGGGGGVGEISSHN